MPASSISHWSCTFLLRRTAPPSSTTNGTLRYFHTSPVLAKLTLISRNNLQKTLEAHRSSNRTGSWRNVPSRVATPTTKRVVVPRDNRNLLSLHELLPRESKPASSSSSISRETSTTRLSRPVKKFERKRKDKKLTSRQLPSTTVVSVSNPTEQRLRFGSYEDGTGRPEQHPWLDNIKNNLDKPRDPMSFLDAEIRALENYLTPTTQELVKVNRLVCSVTELLKDAVCQSPRTPPTTTPQVVGSRSTGMAVSHSDIDFVQPVRWSSDEFGKLDITRPKAISTYTGLLRKMGLALQQDPMFRDRVYLSERRFPVLTATHRSTGLALQFYCGQELPSFVDYIQDYHAEYPALRPLYMATRLILEARDLFGTHTSSVGPEQLLMMIVAYLKISHGRFQRPDNLGEQLLGILQTYGIQTDFQSTGISIDPPGFFNVDTIRDQLELDLDFQKPHFRSQSHSNSPSAHLRGQRSIINTKKTAAAKRNLPLAQRLCIQDPTNYMNDLGRSCTRTSELQASLATAYSRLRGSIDSRVDGSCGSSILTHALRANFDGFERFRRRVSEF